jgi:hypothetical protein
LSRLLVGLQLLWSRFVLWTLYWRAAFLLFRIRRSMRR